MCVCVCVIFWPQSGYFSSSTLLIAITMRTVWIYSGDHFYMDIACVYMHITGTVAKPVSMELCYIYHPDDGRV